LWRFGAGALLLHLGMTGKWSRAANRYVKVRLDLDDGTALHFCDPRLLGGVDFRRVTQLRGHTDVRTTEIYTELARAMRGEITSPLDDL